ncbi:Zn-ribbon domain-containing OB-fold protein [uncultured Mycobacterium sp.]|uniref:Zn-ribbon domain-containing OB-fold protein n=1 Tax=uncultured Mycobacterium sp. TaxID=171292 RepID=UPI0035CAC4DD
MSISDGELVERFAGQPITHDNAEHYRGRLRRQLLMNRCQACGRWHAPPKPVCPQCWSFDVTATAVRGEGTIFMAIFLHQGPPAPGVDYTVPYPVVTVELDEQTGLRFTSTVVGAHKRDIAIGKRVRLGWIERAGAPLPVFELTESAGE